jgi:hypothetical protein
VTAAEYQAIEAQAAADTAKYVAATDRHTHTGAMFDYSQPLPPMPHYRPREWETQEEAR